MNAQGLEVDGIAEIIEAARLADITYTVPTDVQSTTVRGHQQGMFNDTNAVKIVQSAPVVA